MFALYLEISDAAERTLCDFGRFPFVLSLNRNVATSLKAYLKLLHSNLYQKICELTLYLQKLEIYINFLSKCELQRRLVEIN